MNFFRVLAVAAILLMLGCARADGPKVRITEYYSPQCDSCVAMEPVMNELALEYKNRIIVEKINLDTEEGAKAGRALGIKEIPVLIFTDKEGRDYFRHEGKMAPEILRAVIKERL